MRRLVVVPALLTPLFLAGLPSAGAQVPLEETVDQVVHTTEEVVHTTEEVIHTTEEVIHTTEEVVHTAEDVVQTAEDVVQSSTLTQAAEEVTQSTSGTVKETAGSATGGGDGAASGTAGGRATSVAAGGGTSGSSAGKNPNGAGKVRGSAGNKSARGAVRKPMPQPGDEIRGVAPAPALMVTKTNDADGDFTFTSAEIAPQPGADVPFEVSLLNQAAGEVTIGEILDYFPRGGGVEEVRVCNEVTGRLLAPGGSVTCAFTLEAYSTEKGGRVINTIRVQGTVNHNGASVSGSDASTVATAGERVLGLAIAQPPGSMAKTGAAIIQLLRLATLLALMGMLCVAASAHGERRVQARVDAAAQSIRFGLASPRSPRGL